MPVWSAAPCPRLMTWRSTTTPDTLACWNVSSYDPSSVTTTDQPSATSSRTTAPITRASLNAAITTHVDRRECPFTALDIARLTEAEAAGRATAATET